MIKKYLLNPRSILPLALLILYGIMATILLIKEFSVVNLLLIVGAGLIGFLIGLRDNPGLRFREKKVRKQSSDLEKLSDKIKIQTAAIEYAGNGIIITDTKGMIQWVNPAFCKLTGFTYDESIGSSFKMMSSGEHDEVFFKNMWSTILSGNVWHDEIINRRKDGSLFTEEMTITPVKNEKGIVTNFVAIKQDITERKRLEEISKIEKDRMKTELDVARNIQMSLLQLEFPPFPEREDIGIFARLIPAREVGGDFYDFFWIDEENLCFLVGDVSGKGVPAAIMMAVTKTLLKSWATKEKSVARTLTNANHEISKDNDNFMFITVFMAILNTTTGYLTYSNAGHNPSYLREQQSGQLKKLGDLHGVVIGAMEDTSYGETVVRINRGDLILVYTDGVTEARNESNELFTDEKFYKLLLEYKTSPPEKLTNDIIDQVKIHENGAEQADDITLLCIDYKEPGKDSKFDYLSTIISNDIKNIREFISKFDEFANKHKMPTEPVQQINIVFDELLSNIISYAYPDNQEHDIEIKVFFNQGKLTATIMDDGIPYNPFDRMDPDTSLSIEDRDIGGLGVHLVKFLVDEYDYEFKDQINRNVTHFSKEIN